MGDFLVFAFRLILCAAYYAAADRADTRADSSSFQAATGLVTDYSACGGADNRAQDSVFLGMYCGSGAGAPCDRKSHYRRH
jgi:hypothetical protein